MQILMLIKNQLKLLFNNRIAIFAILAAPLLLTYLFSFSESNSKINLYIADSDKSVYSKQLINMLSKHNEINIVNLSESELEKKLDNNSISFGFVINKNFGDSLTSSKSLNMKTLENYETGDGALLEQIVLSEANTLKKVTLDSKIISQTLNLSNDSVSNELFKNVKNDVNISITDRTLKDDHGNHTSTISRLIGFLVMFLWFVVIQGFRTLIEEKNNNTFERILGTPTNYTKYLISKIAATYIFGLIVIVTILIAGKYLFKVNLITNLPVESIIFGAYLLALTGVVMIFVPFIKKQQSFTILGAILMALTGILGGCFFSIDEITSSAMQLISKFTPEAWAIKSINAAIFNNTSINTEFPSIIILTFVGISGLTISYLLLNLKIRAERA
ncbi:permease [Clostridium zeae]|uniref:Permease n=1 Tax=Clostridium zeae TaxID=2759022 RepID=A0ABQ1EE39_9CLOT|nr:ABC transporter permease [Clostridium zeae]GFZ33085.1 permease [Clostridium zeae]